MYSTLYREKEDNKSTRCCCQTHVFYSQSHAREIYVVLWRQGWSKYLSSVVLFVFNRHRVVNTQPHFLLPDHINVHEGPNLCRAWRWQEQIILTSPHWLITVMSEGKVGGGYFFKMTFFSHEIQSYTIQSSRIVKRQKQKIELTLKNDRTTLPTLARRGSHN